jgi:hypothetical protein
MKKIIKLLALSVVGVFLLTGCGDEEVAGVSVKYGQGDVTVDKNMVVEYNSREKAEGAYFYADYIEGENSLVFKDGQVVTQILKNKKDNHTYTLNYANKKLTSMSSTGGFNHKFHTDGRIKEINYDLPESSSQLIVDFSNGRSLKYALIKDKKSNQKIEYSNRTLMIYDLTTGDKLARYRSGDVKFNPIKNNFWGQINSLDKQLKNSYTQTLKSVR